MGKGFWKPEQTACSLQGDKNEDHHFQTHATTAARERAVTQLLLRREICFSLGKAQGSVSGAEELVLAVI